MSRWTHVAGVIRIDSLPLAVLGPARADWEGDLRRQLEAKPGPKGSEGGLTMTMVQAPTSENALSRGYVVVYGDLRDFGEKEDVAEIVEWLGWLFPSVDEALRQMKAGDKSAMYSVRQGIVEVVDEMGMNSCVLRYEDEDDPRQGRWLEIHEAR